MLAHENQGAWGRTNEMDNVPLFEREHRHDSQYVQRIQSELTDAKRLLDAQSRRQTELEYVNEDLEIRLEEQARERIELESLKSEQEKQFANEKIKFQNEIEGCQKRYEDEKKLRAIIEERLRRAEKELYRMHQKKYDIEKSVRHEESEKRKTEAYIARNIEKESHQINSNRKYGEFNNRFPNFNPNSNPKDLKPQAIRTKQAISSAMDFFGF